MRIASTVRPCLGDASRLTMQRNVEQRVNINFFVKLGKTAVEMLRIEYGDKAMK